MRIAFNTQAGIQRIGNFNVLGFNGRIRDQQPCPKRVRLIAHKVQPLDARFFHAARHNVDTRVTRRRRVTVDHYMMRRLRHNVHPVFQFQRTEIVSWWHHDGVPRKRISQRFLDSERVTRVHQNLSRSVRRNSYCHGSARLLLIVPEETPDGKTNHHANQQH